MEENINLFIELIFNNEKDIKNRILILDWDEDQMTRGMGGPESTPGYDKCKEGNGRCWVNTNWCGYNVMASAV